MLSSTATFETQHGKKYLGQLCKHFAHKIEVRYTDTHGECALPPGPATLEADDDIIRITVTAKDDAGIKVAQYIIDSHIVKFAFREKLETLNWE